VIEKIQVSGSKPKAVSAKPEVESSKPKVEKKTAEKKSESKLPIKKSVAKKVEAIDYSKLTLIQLKEEARKKGIKGISAMKKSDLIAVLSK